MAQKIITIEEVLEFIKKDGYKYDYEIQKALDEINPIGDEKIQKELYENDDLYRKMADM
ncbi:hypothetical protein N2W52_002054 [Clostridium perfringens]|nr:hypothetical protein [Clostridium perfringens]MDK0983071.1 hypothetical protein [Clostridium perfringens]